MNTIFGANLKCLHVFYEHNAYKHIQAQILQKHMLSLNFTKFQSIYTRKFTKNTHNVQIAHHMLIKKRLAIIIYL